MLWTQCDAVAEQLAACSSMGWVPSLDPAARHLSLMKFLCSHAQALRMLLWRTRARQATQDVHASARVALRAVAKQVGVPLPKDLSLQAGCAALLPPVQAQVQASTAHSSSSSAATSASLHPALPATVFQPAGVLPLFTQISAALAADYSVRRRMLAKRMELTLGAFMSSDKAAAAGTELHRYVQAAMAEIQQPQVMVHPAEIVALRKRDVAYLMLAVHRCEAGRAIKAARIGSVPDRGGRANEMRPSKRDLMPAWSSRKPPALGAAAASGAGRSSNQSAGAKRGRGGGRRRG